MRIKSGSIIYKLNYEGVDPKNIPDAVGRCRLLWGACQGILLLALGAFYVAGRGLIFVVGTPLAFVLLGMKPNLSWWKHRLDEEAGERKFVPITWWPEYKGRKVWPIVLFSAVGIGWLGGMTFAFWTSDMESFLQFYPWEGSVAWATYLVFVLMVLVCGTGLVIMFDTETLREWEDKVCPAVEIEKPGDSN